MGSGGTEWEANDSIGKARLNQKTVFVSSTAPTGADILAEGVIWIDTSNNPNHISIYDLTNTQWLTIGFTSTGSDPTIIFNMNDGSRTLDMSANLTVASTTTLNGNPSRIVMLGAPVNILSTASCPTSFTDLDVTAQTGANATAAILACSILDAVESDELRVRENGVTSGGQNADGSQTVCAVYFRKVALGESFGTVIVPLDAGEIFEYMTTVNGSMDVEIDIIGYIEEY